MLGTDVKKSFTKQFGANLTTVTPTDTAEVFGPTLKDKMAAYSKDGADQQASDPLPPLITAALAAIGHRIQQL